MTVPNEEQEVPPPERAPFESAVFVVDAPPDTNCGICTLPLQHRQTIMVTNTDVYIHSYCWENR